MCVSPASVKVTTANADIVDFAAFRDPTSALGMGWSSVYSRYQLTGINVGGGTYYDLAIGNTPAELGFLLAYGGDITVYKDFVCDEDFTIRADTADGSDNQKVVIAGGGLGTQARGAYATFHGNEYTAAADTTKKEAS